MLLKRLNLCLLISAQVMSNVAIANSTNPYTNSNSPRVNGQQGLQGFKEIKRDQPTVSISAGTVVSQNGGYQIVRTGGANNSNVNPVREKLSVPPHIQRAIDAGNMSTPAQPSAAVNPPVSNPNVQQIAQQPVQVTQPVQSVAAVVPVAPVQIQTSNHNGAKRYKILLGAFMPWTGETNMAEIVSNEVQKIIKQNGMAYSELDIETILLPVQYDNAAFEVVKYARQMPTPPDLVVVIGQGTAKVTIETGGDKTDSANQDTSYRIRTAKSFPGLPDSVAVTFPANELYCALSENQRKSVDVSFRPGNFVCNDITYQLSMGLQSQEYVDHLFGPQLTALDNEFAMKSAMLERQFKQDTDAEAVRVDAARQAELDSKSYRKFVKEQKEVIDYNRSIEGQLDSNKMPLAPKAIPQFRSSVSDRRSQIKTEYESALSQLRSDLSYKKSRMSNLKQNWGLPIGTRFAFIHVPVSSGQSHDYVYELADARKIGFKDSLPPSENGDTWYEIDQAARIMGKNPRKLEIEAVDLATKIERQEQERMKEEASRIAKAEKKKHKQEQERSPDNDEVNWSQAPVAAVPLPQVRYIVRLSKSLPKTAIKETGKANDYARTILDMIVGAYRRQNMAHLKELPLPTLSNTVTLPRTKQDISRMRALLDDLRSKPKEANVSRSVLETDEQGNSVVRNFTETVILPAQIPGDLKECYDDFLGKISRDREDDLNPNNVHSRR